MLIAIIIAGCEEGEIKEDGICSKYPEICDARHSDTFCAKERESYIKSRYRNEIKDKKENESIYDRINKNRKYYSCLLEKLQVRHISDKSRESDRIKTMGKLKKKEQEIINQCAKEMKKNIYCATIVYLNSKNEESKKYIIELMSKDFIYNEEAIISYLEITKDTNPKEARWKVQKLIDNRRTISNKVFLLQNIIRLYSYQKGISSKEYILHVLALAKIKEDVFKEDRRKTSNYYQKEMEGEALIIKKHILNSSYSDSKYYLAD